MGDESLLEEMRAAVRGDRQRAEKRRAERPSMPAPEEPEPDVDGPPVEAREPAKESGWLRRVMGSTRRPR